MTDFCPPEKVIDIRSYLASAPKYQRKDYGFSRPLTDVYRAEQIEDSEPFINVIKDVKDNDEDALKILFTLFKPQIDYYASYYRQGSLKSSSFTTYNNHAIHDLRQLAKTTLWQVAKNFKLSQMRTADHYHQALHKFKGVATMTIKHALKAEAYQYKHLGVNTPTEPSKYTDWTKLNVHSIDSSPAPGIAPKKKLPL